MMGGGNHRKTLIAAALACIGFTAALPAQAGEAELMAEIRKLADRVEKLEKRNAELEEKLSTQKPAGDTGLAQRVKSLEEQNRQIEAALESERISENEPDLVARLKSAETKALGFQKQARMVEALDGITGGLSFTTVAQRASPSSTVDGSGESQLSYRADVAVSFPAGKIGQADGKIFAHFRMGQGAGLSELPTTFSSTNGTVFQLGGISQPDDSVVMLAEAWYQATIPLPLNGFKQHSKERLEFNFGKMDPFVFFDQNGGANDEARQFLASMFVHNALLDNPVAANVGADANGFTPGVRLAYINESEKPESYGFSLGVFGAGPGANFSKSFSSPFVIAQGETKFKLGVGMEGNYRLYFWRNGQAQTYVDGQLAKHRGVGFSFDQRVSENTLLFGRLGKAWGDFLPFDRTASLGAEFGGAAWDRGADVIGLAFGANRPSSDFRRDAFILDADADGTPDFGYQPDGSEQVAELYYRYRVNKQFELSPDFQYFRRPGGNSQAASAKVLGLRAQLTF